MLYRMNFGARIQSSNVQNAYSHLALGDNQKAAASNYINEDKKTGESIFFLESPPKAMISMKQMSVSRGGLLMEKKNKKMVPLYPPTLSRERLTGPRDVKPGGWPSDRTSIT